MYQLIQFTYLLIHEAGPEPDSGASERVGRHERRPIKCLINVLDDDERLADGRPVAVEEHRHLLVDGVVLQEQLALAVEVFSDELVGNPLQPQRQLGAVHHRAAEAADELHRLGHHQQCLLALVSH
jgi:hypothetical protein